MVLRLIFADNSLQCIFECADEKLRVVMSNIVISFFESILLMIDFVKVHFNKNRFQLTSKDCELNSAFLISMPGLKNLPK